jgi:5'-nucleotidase
MILLTNDDGIYAPGLLPTKRALESVGEVVVFVPEQGWSAGGHAKTMHKPLRVKRVALRDGFPAYITDGTPSDCVALALLGILQERPELVVSGINQGANVGNDVTYSGTVAAAMESVIFGVPAIAISLDTYGTLKGDAYIYAADFTARLASLVLANGLPEGTFLNVNIPAVPREEIQGVKVTRLGTRLYRDVLVRRKDPRGCDYYWIGGEPPSGVIEEGTDIWALANNYISITPLHLDMTEYHLLEKLKGYFENVGFENKNRNVASSLRAK